MIDRAEIFVKAGNGGNGAVDFLPRRGKPFGPPAGGDGARGGSVYFEVSDSLSTLLGFRHKKQYEAPDGGHGGTNQKSGLSGEDIIIAVPKGTIIIDVDTKKQVIDMAKSEDRVLIAQGGQGGRGNMHLRKKAAHAKRPLDWEQWNTAQDGKPGEAHNLKLELKLLADIGLVGLPNAGKSTLLSVLTKATPKIADYPFTTLEPNLGVMTVGSQSFVIADIPGLIEGASEGKGLGKDFLRHIERTRVLVHLTDSYNHYQTIRKELGSYDSSLLTKPEIIVLSKADLLSDQDLSQTMASFKEHDLAILPISAQAQTKLDQLKQALLTALSI